MKLLSCLHYTILLNLAFALPFSNGASFTFINKCDYTVWPGILPNAGIETLITTGFQLPTQTSLTLEAPIGWSGRFWARTGCNFETGSPQTGFCTTADCGSGTVECSGSGPQPPATLAEITLGVAGQHDFYDVSLVDGFNVPILIEPLTGSGSNACDSTGCLVDVNPVCPVELQAGNGSACMSACVAFGTPEYCCSGAYGSPATCKPTVYSEIFKSACRKAYSYAYDDVTSIFTCIAADYAITFCPSSPRQLQKSTTTTAITHPMITNTFTPPSGSSGLQHEVTESDPRSTVVADGSWLAELAMGDSTMTKPISCFLYLWSCLLIALSFSATL